MPEALAIFAQLERDNISFFVDLVLKCSLRVSICVKFIKNIG